MKPYCYKIQEWEEVDIFPSLDKAVEWLKKNGRSPAHLYESSPVLAYYEDKEDGKVVELHDYIEKVDVDMDKIRPKAQAMWDKSKRKEEETLKREGKLSTVTGFLPLCYCPVEDIVKSLVTHFSYRWKGERTDYDSELGMVGPTGIFETKF